MHNIFGLSFIPLFALAACAAETNEPIKRARNIAAPSNTSFEQNRARLLKETMLVEHNKARKEVGTPPLSWDDKLTQDARIYAEYLAKHNIFEHDAQKGVTKRQGENLWMGTSGAFSFTKMADGWISEKQIFKPGVFPDNSTTGNWAEVGHYTQIIWRSTTHLGCAIADNAQDDFLVCRYSPAGNVFTVDPINH